MNNTTLLNDTTTTTDHVTANQGFDAYMYVAYACLLVSYVNVNILVFRFWLILSAVFFIVWGLEPERSVQVDTLIFNAIFIIINIVQSVPLVRQIWPVKLTELEEEIYERDFKIQMSKRQFKFFIKNFGLDHYEGHKSQLCSHQSSFRHLIYIAKIYPGWRVTLMDKDGMTVKELHEGSWIGTIEYIQYEELCAAQKQNEKPESDVELEWGISAFLERKEIVEERGPVTQTEQNLLPRTRNKAGVIIYKIELDVS
jgi:hypothetical protein